MAGVLDIRKFFDIRLHLFVRYIFFLVQIQESKVYKNQMRSCAASLTGKVGTQAARWSLSYHGDLVMSPLVELSSFYMSMPAGVSEPSACELCANARVPVSQVGKRHIQQRHGARSFHIWPFFWNTTNDNIVEVSAQLTSRYLLDFGIRYSASTLKIWYAMLNQGQLNRIIHVLSNPVIILTFRD